VCKARLYRKFITLCLAEVHGMDGEGGGRTGYREFRTRWLPRVGLGGTLGDAVP